MEPHIPLMFPVDESIGEERLVQPLESVLQDWQTFPIHLQRFQISPDELLLLLIQQGNEDIIRLHEKDITFVSPYHFWRNQTEFDQPGSCSGRGRAIRMRFSLHAVSAASGEGQ